MSAFNFGQKAHRALAVAFAFTAILAVLWQTQSNDAPNNQRADAETPPATAALIELIDEQTAYIAPDAAFHDQEVVTVTTMLMLMADVQDLHGAGVDDEVPVDSPYYLIQEDLDRAFALIALTESPTFTKDSNASLFDLYEVMQGHLR